MLGMTTTDQPQRTSPGDYEELPNYRPVCGMAVVAFVFSIASVLAIFGPVFWGLPLIAACLAIVALRRIAAHEPPLWGRRLAFAALFLGAICGAAGVSQWYVHNLLVRRQAQQLAEAWFGYMLRGETNKAHQMTLEPQRRELRVDELDAIYLNNPDLDEALAKFIAEPGSAAVLKFGTDAKLEYLTSPRQELDGDDDYVWLTYRLSDAAVPPHTADIVISFKRDGGEDPGWMVFEVIDGNTFLQR
jgi:hypothetical protein